MVEAHHRGELLGIEALGIAQRNQRVGVGGVAHHQHAHVTAGLGVDGLALHREDGGVGGEQVFAFHAGATRAGADQQGVVGAIKGDVGIVGGDDFVHQREGAVVHFHHRALQLFHALRNVEQLQNHRLVLAQHVTGGNAENQRVGNLTSCAGDGNAYRLFHVNELRNRRTTDGRGRHFSA